ncbi:MAG: hypothetical protein K1X47_01245 [Cyclobacteriaceae bacterium]|nr:hypothetical protein [Cyclobacteriaceae bacterium]
MSVRIIAAVLLLVGLSSCQYQSSPVMPISVYFPDSLVNKPLDGRLLLMLSKDSTQEPRFQINDGLNTQLIFGMDLESTSPNPSVQFDLQAFGFPIRNLADVPAGDYFVQVLFNRYETFKLKSGHTVKLPPDKGEGQQWNRKPGNLYSRPVKVRVGGSPGLTLKLTQVIDPLVEPTDSKYVRHIRVQSKLLTEWWGRPMYVGAHVLLPEGFEEHPEARYPLMVYHGHFPTDFGGFRTTPPDPRIDTTDFNERFRVYGYNKLQQEEAYRFYQQWTSRNFPRFIVIEIQHANPYYDDSYAVNSANLGPYGDAIMYELIPEVEKQFRGIGQGWARFTYGGSTGGWEALAVQMFYPTEFNGCFAACPDPVDFRAYCLVNIYKDKNAYYYDSQFKKLARPAFRDYLGQIRTTVEQTNHYELALGTRSRSGQQWDIWEAVYSPQGDDGYPKRIFDKVTGDIDTTVAAYWRDHYDLRHILQRDWNKLGPLLKGKIHIYCGDMDNLYLNDAVYLMEDFLRKTKSPFYEGEVDYGDRAEHCWNGDHEHPNHISRLRYNTMYLPKILKRIEQSAPPGTNVDLWKY